MGCPEIVVYPFSKQLQYLTISGLHIKMCLPNAFQNVYNTMGVFLYFDCNWPKTTHNCHFWQYVSYYKEFGIHVVINSSSHLYLVSKSYNNLGFIWSSEGAKANLVYYWLLDQAYILSLRSTKGVKLMKYPVHRFQWLHGCIRHGFKLLNPEGGLIASWVTNMQFLGKGGMVNCMAIVINWS